MNWLALSQTVAVMVGTASLCNMVRLYFLDKKARTLHRVWRRGAFMLIGRGANDQEILELCELCRRAAMEIAQDMKSINPSYWILNINKQYNIPTILERYATLRKAYNPNLRH